jgi:tripartite-type tricarboxylate transporter receptor subunit TctC
MQSIAARGYAFVAASACLIAAADAAPAQSSYPDRPIRFITPYAPGGSTTLMARLVAQHLTERWGQNVIVDNRPGGNTVIGTEIVAKAPPDGYTLLLTPITHCILSSLMKTPYDPVKDFAPVAGVAISPQLLVVHPSVAANGVQELIALAKAKPGQLTFASSGAGGTSHLAGEVFNMLAGVDTRHIPYKGGGPATTDLLGGHVLMFYSVPLNVIPHVLSGKLKAIGVTGQHRLSALPRTPTFAEAGLPGFDVVTWNGVTAPAATPKAIVDKLSAEIVAMLGMPAVKEKLEAIGTSPMVMNADRFGALIRSDIAMYAKVIKTARLRID